MIILSTLVKLVSLASASQCGDVSVEITGSIKLARRLTIKDFVNSYILRGYPSKILRAFLWNSGKSGIAAASFIDLLVGLGLRRMGSHAFKLAGNAQEQELPLCVFVTTLSPRLHATYHLNGCPVFE